MDRSSWYGESIMVYHRVIYMANYMASDTVVEGREHMAKATKKNHLQESNMNRATLR